LLQDNFLLSSRCVISLAGNVHFQASKLLTIQLSARQSIQMKQILAIVALALSAIVNQLNAAPLDGTYYFWGSASKPDTGTDTSSADIAGKVIIAGSSITGNATIREYGASEKIYNVISGSIGTHSSYTSGRITIAPYGLGLGVTVNPTTKSADATFTLRNGTGLTSDTWIFKGRIRSSSYVYTAPRSTALPITVRFLMGSIFNTAASKKWNGQLMGQDYFPWY